MTTRRDAVLERARTAGLVDAAAESRAAAARDAYRRFGVDLHVVDLLAAAGRIPQDEVEEASRGEEIPSRIAGLDVVRLAGGTPERPVFLARRAADGETFLVHACMRTRGEAPGEVDAFVRAMEDGRRLTGDGWIPVREAAGADGAYAAVSAVPEGMRLDERLASRGYLPPTEAVALLERLGDAMWPLEALGRAAVFPDPSLVLLDGQGRPSLVAMEVLLASRTGAFDASELARSAANLLARLVGPQRVQDAAVQGLLAELSSGRLGTLRGRRAAEASHSPARTSFGGPSVPLELETTTPTEVPPLPSTVPGMRPRPAPSPPPVARRPIPVAVLVAGVLAAGAVAYGLLRHGEEPSTDGGSRAVVERDRPEARREPRPTPPPATGTSAPARDPGLAALEEATRYLASHREDDPQGVIDRFRGVEARFGGTEAGERASSEREQFVKETEARAEREALAISGDVERLVAAEELGAAYAALDRFPKRLAFTHASVRIEALKARVKERAEAVYATLRPRIDAASDPARQDDARAAVERVKSLGDPELTERAQRRWKDAVERAAGREARRKGLEPALAAAVGEVLATAGAGETDRARKAVEALGRGPLAEAFPERVSAARDAVDRIVRTYEAAATEWRARAGKTASVTLREYGAKPFSVTPGEVVGDRVAWTRGGLAGGARLGTLDPEAVASLALSGGREADAQAVLGVATLEAAAGRFPEAEAARARAEGLGATAPTFSAEAAAVRAHLEALASREVAAADALADRDRDAARAAYGRAATTAPFLPLPHRRLAAAAAADRRTEEALEEWRRAKALGDASADVLHGLARASAAAGRPDDETLEAWRAFLAAAPAGDPRVEAARAEVDRLATKVVRGSTLDRVRAAKALLDAGKAAEAVAALEEAVAADPGSIEAQRALARAAEKAEDVLKAYLAWRAAHALSKSTKDAADAKEQMDRLERLHGERPAEALVRKGAEEASAKGEYAGAAETFRRAVAMSPLDVDARLGLGGALLGLAVRTNSKGVFEEAYGAYDVVVRMAPEDARGWAGRGELRRWRGDFAGAVLDATEAVTRRKDFVQAYNTRALAQYQSLAYDAALADLNVVTTLAPLLATPRITRAGVLAVLGRYDDAEHDLNAALERNPTDAERKQVEDLRAQIALRRKADKR